jgi:5'-3' exonuclease
MICPFAITLQLVLAPALKQQRENEAASNATSTGSSHTEHPLPRVAFAFDSGTKSFRQTLYPAYKVQYLHRSILLQQLLALLH